MIYKDFQDIKLSQFGMGCMRLPVINGDDSRIDVEQAEAMVDYAMKNGVNYYDTAYDYHSGNSERVLGKALSKYDRKSFYIADKYPGYNPGNLTSHEKIKSVFEEQLERLGVDYFDFYLFHNVYEKNVGPYLDEDLGVLKYLQEQKKAGKIRHLGFSCHGRIDVLERFLKAYGDEMEFCQLQINYFDWEFQGAKEKVELVRSYGIPIWVMEPVRGGRLTKFTDEELKMFKDARPDETGTAWAFRFLQSIPGVTVVLSGSSSLEQMKDNIKTFEKEEPLNTNEMEIVKKVADSMGSSVMVPCTACHYCTSHCPQELDIPLLLSLYNEHKFTGGGFIAPMAIGAMPANKQPSACIACKSCEEVCPQQIKISEILADYANIM
jgi:Predicted oxidoreductases of the aldo/keto reductase family